MDTYLQGLNKQQKLAVTTTEGPVLVVAGAGSGKTRTITCKIVHLIHTGLCDPQQILAMTFTNKAAQEMRLRVEHLLGDPASVPLLSTFHSFCVRVLRRHANLLGYGQDFAICDTDDQNTILKKICRATDINLTIGRIRNIISRKKNRSRNHGTGYTLENYEHTEFEVGEYMMTAYQDQLFKSNAMDFDDLLLLTDKLFCEHPEILKNYSQQYRYLLIDEYQDTNASQYALVKHLTSLFQNVTAVGDEDQSIYSFRGADIGNILNFEKDFPGTTVVKLEENYRSRQRILDAASAVVARNTQRKPKRLWTKNPAGDLVKVYIAQNARDEAGFVCRQIEQLLQRGEKKIAILYRINFQSRQFEEALTSFGLPYRLVGGLSFYKRKEIRDALAYLRVAYNPRDDLAMERIINNPARGIGKLTLDRLRQSATQNDDSLWDSVCQSARRKDSPSRLKKTLENFIILVEKWQHLLHQEGPLHLDLKEILGSSGYIRALEREESEEAENRILNLKELIGVAGEYFSSGRTLQDFLDETSLRSEVDDYEKSDAITLMTLHNAKGLEFPIVFLVGMEEGLLPHARSIKENALEEERRLCYVGMTRSQENLILSYSRSRRLLGQELEEQCQPSCFLTEIPSELLIFLQSEWSQSRFEKARTTRSVYPWISGDPLPTRKSLHRSPSSFVPGAQVEHPKFGYGTILQVQKVQGDLKLTVSFSGRGIKKFYQRYAQLKLL